MSLLDAAVGWARRELGSACAFVWWAQTGGGIGHYRVLRGDLLNSAGYLRRPDWGVAEGLSAALEVALVFARQD